MQNFDSDESNFRLLAKDEGLANFKTKFSSTYSAVDVILIPRP